jgi:hypothetical protein
MAVQNVILVGGFNYENDKNPEFLQAAKNRMARLLAKSTPGGDLVFTLFDVAGGTVTQSTVDPTTKKRAWEHDPDLHSGHARQLQHIRRGAAESIQSESLGRHVNPGRVRVVRNLGAGSDKGTLTELSFFTPVFRAASFDATETIQQLPETQTTKTPL